MQTSSRAETCGGDGESSAPGAGHCARGRRSAAARGGPRGRTTAGRQCDAAALSLLSCRSGDVPEGERWTPQLGGFIPVKRPCGPDGAENMTRALSILAYLLSLVHCECVFPSICAWTSSFFLDSSGVCFQIVASVGETASVPE